MKKVFGIIGLAYDEWAIFKLLGLFINECFSLATYLLSLLVLMENTRILVKGSLSGWE